jgi:hypothetical protein
MAWDPITFTPPPVLADALSSVDAGLGLAISDLGSVRDAILASPAIDAPNSGVEPHTGAEFGRDDVYGLGLPVLRSVVIHPWCEGVAQGVGHYRNLSSRNAVKAAAKKLGDVLDLQRPAGAMDVLALLVSGSSYADLHQKLLQVLTVFSEPILLMCARRCAQLAALENDKTLLPDGGINARFKHFSPASCNAIANFSGAVGETVALGDAVSIAGGSAETDLVALTKKKQALIETVQADANSALENFTGGAGQLYFLSGTTANVASRALIDADVGHEYPYAVCVLVTGAPGALDGLRGMMQ